MSRKPSPTITFLTQDELKRLMATIKDKRDRAIFLSPIATASVPSKLQFIRLYQLGSHL